jgi:hypothetical protein
VRESKPMCKNPDHPEGKSRDSMVCAQETDTYFVFFCQTCATVKKIKSIQVRTRAAFKREVRQQLIREGRVMKGPPPMIRRTRMDESMMDRERVFGGKR